MSDIKMLFIPKMKGDKQPAIVVKAMKEYLSHNSINHIIVSPGYLSTTECTIDSFTKQFSTEIGNKWRVYLLNGMNGWNKVRFSSKGILEFHISKGATKGLAFKDLAKRGL